MISTINLCSAKSCILPFCTTCVPRSRHFPSFHESLGRCTGWTSNQAAKTIRDRPSTIAFRCMLWMIIGTCQEAPKVFDIILKVVLPKNEIAHMSRGGESGYLPVTPQHLALTSRDK